jgi:dethiobiotin synthase
VLIVCTGTGTSVGKTWASAAILSRLVAAGRTVAARKPAQSFEPPATGQTDADILAAACGATAAEVCPTHRWYPVAMAPPMAAAALGRPAFTMADLIGELRWPRPEADVHWVEGAGGVRSPLTEDGDTVELCRRLGPDLVLLVADAGLGTINSVRLSAGALAGVRLLVLLNRYDDGDDLHRRNREWLADRDGLDVVCDVDAVVGRLRPATARRS